MATKRTCDLSLVLAILLVLVIIGFIAYGCWYFMELFHKVPTFNFVKQQQEKLLTYARSVWMEAVEEGHFQDWLEDIVFRLDINESAVKVPVEETVCLEWGEKEVCEGGIIMAGIVPVPAEDCHTESYCKRYGTTIVNETDEHLVCKELLKKIDVDVNKYYCDINLEGIDAKRWLYRAVIEIEPIDEENTTKKEVEKIVNKIANLLKENDLCADIHTDVEEDIFTFGGTVSRDIEGYVECYFPS